MPKFDDAEEYRQALLQCYLAVRFIVNLRLNDLAEAQQHAEAIGWFLDPTAYRDNMEKLREDSAVVAALRKAVAALPESLRVQLRRELDHAPVR